MLTIQPDSDTEDEPMGRDGPIFDRSQVRDSLMFDTKFVCTLVLP